MLLVLNSTLNIETLKKVVKILSDIKESREEAEKNIYGRPKANVT